MWAQRRTTKNTATLTMIAAVTSQKSSSSTGSGKYMPRLLRKKPSPSERLCRGPGSGRSTAKYQKKICSNRGMLRSISIYTIEIFEISQLVESRATPTMKPRIVASITPQTEIQMVFSRPTRKVRP